MSPFDGSLDSLSPPLVAKLLDGDERQRRRLAELVLREIDKAVFHALRDHPPSLSHKDDIVSELVVYVYREDAKILRRWDPKRAGLPGYLKMIASRHARRTVASRPPPASLDEEGPDVPYLPHASAETELAYRRALARVATHLRDRGSPKDRARFWAMFVQGRSPAEVARDEGSSVDALHTWASRFKRRLQRAFPELGALLRGEPADRSRRHQPPPRE